MRREGQGHCRGGCGDGGHGREPQAEGKGPQRGRMERRSTGAQTGTGGAPGQRDAGRVMGTASSVGQSEKPDKML